ncbi:MAG: hypothetical protein GXY36_07025 [Chloroflexi bacterium]|nr:hypothetical protein [Chloroflexota bacterium]
MLYAKLQRFVSSIREGLNAGFVAGVVNLFLILIGISTQLRNLAIFLFLLVMMIFGIRLARRLRERSLGHVMLNAVAMGAVATVMIFLLLALVNRWQAKGIDVKQYFNAITTETMEVLSGVPEEELHPNPDIDPLTGEYEAGEPLRTNPLRLSFDRDTAIHLRFGLTGQSWIDLKLGLGGVHGFMLLLMLSGLLSAAVVWAAVRVDTSRYRVRTSAYVAGNPIAHWLVLLLPLIAFAFLWLTKGHAGGGALINLGSGAQQVQLLLSFMIILFALVSIRAAQKTTRDLGYSTRLAVVVGLVILLAGLAIWRIVGNNTYFVAPPSEPGGSQTLSIILVLAIAAVMVLQNIRALRDPSRFESQLAGTVSLGVMLLMPLYLDQYQNDVLTLVGINILLGLGLNIVVGYAGLLDLGYVAFFALGSYTYAFLSSRQTVMDANNQPAGLKFDGNTEMVLTLAAWMVTAAIIASAVAAIGIYLWRRRETIHAQQAQATANGRRILGTRAVRPSKSISLLLIVIAVGTSLIAAFILDSSGVYDRVFSGVSPFLIGLVVGVITSGIAGIMLGIPVLRLRGDYLAIVTLGFGEIIRLLFNNLRDFTGGPQGVLQIPRPLPDGASGTVTYLSIVYLVFLGAGLVAFFSIRLNQSRTGRAWSAMKSDESIAQSMGINLVQSKLMAFAIGAAFAGIGGVIFAARQRNIFPGDFNLNVSIEVLSLVIIGGMGSIPGVIMGAVVLIGIPEVLRELSTYRILVFGALLVAMVILRPRGLLPAPTAELQERAAGLLYRKKEGQL